MPEATVRLVDEVDATSLIKNRVFEGVIVEGPAVCAPLREGPLTLDNCVIEAFDNDPRSVFIPVEASVYLGFVGLADVEFHNCHFKNVSFAVPTSEVDEWIERLDRGGMQS